MKNQLFIEELEHLLDRLNPGIENKIRCPRCIEYASEIVYGKMRIDPYLYSRKNILEIVVMCDDCYQEENGWF